MTLKFPAGLTSSPNRRHFSAMRLPILASLGNDSLVAGSFDTDVNIINVVVDIMSGCFLARWRFNNALIKPRLYLMQREMKGQVAQSGPTGYEIIDEMNPRFFSNNLLLPYLVGIWEEYFKSSFVVLLQYSKTRGSALKRAKLRQEHLEAIAAGEQNIEQSLGETLLFQRPSKVAANFKLVDPQMDIAGALRKPYRRRKTSLFDSIELCVEMRNELVHTGQMDSTLTDKRIPKNN